MFFLPPKFRATGVACVVWTAAGVLGWAVGSARAQTPPTSPSAPAAPGAPATSPGRPLPPAAETVRLQMPNADVRDVLRYYEELTGKKLILDQTIQGQLNININTPVTRDEAVKIIETTLLLNGFSLVPGDGGLTKVLGISKNPRQAGVSIYSSVEQLPDAELVASLLFRLRYVDPTELQQILQQYIPAQTFTSFIALPKSNSLLITESTSVIRRLAQLVREADIPPAEVVQEFIPLEYADATKAVEFLNSIFEKKDAQSATRPGGAPGAARPRVNPVPAAPGAPAVAVPAVLEAPGLAGALGFLSEDSLIIGKIQLTADVRTNRVHVVTRPINMRFVKKLLAEYDTATKFGEPLKIRLRFISARDVLPILVQSLTDPGGDQSGAGATAGAPGAPRPAGTAGNNSATNLNRTSATSTGSGGLAGSTGSGGSLNLTQGLETQPVDTTPQAVTVGTTSIIADPRDNAIIIRGGAEARIRAERVIALLDVRAPQVQISAVIGELSLGNNTEYGVNYVVRSRSPATVFTRFDGTTVIDRGNPVTNSTSTATGTSGAITASTILGALTSSLGGFNGVGAIIRGTDSFDIILKALEGTNRFKTISRPTIFTINNNKAVIASGQEIAVPTSTISSVGTIGTTTGVSNGLAQQSNIQFKSVTLQLEVVPLVNRENEVTLDILQKIDSVVAGASVNIAGTNVPTIATRYIRSKVSVPNNATVVLGGLIQQSESKSQNGIPYLSRIPVLGALFRDQTRAANRSELVILLRPIVTNSDSQVYRNRAEEQKRLLLKAPRDAELEDQLYPPGVDAEEPSRVAVPVNPPRRTVTTTTTTRTTVRRPAAVVTSGKETVPVKKTKRPAPKPTPTPAREPAPVVVPDPG